MTKPEHISALKHDPRNARQHTPRTLSTIERSLNRDGFGRSILLAKDGTIIAGNATTDAAINAGLENVRIIDSDGTEVIAVRRTDIEPGSAEFTHLAIADNRAAEHSSFSPDVLQALIDDGLVEPDEFWFPEELTEVLAGDGDDEPAGGNTDPDEVPDVPEEPTTKPGDLWQLGRHRLLCGDSTVVTDVDRLMDGQKADLLLTDPPYGIGADTHAGKTENGWTQYNSGGWDKMRPDDGWWTVGSLLAENHIVWGGNYFTDILPVSQCWLVWDKGQREFSLADGELAWTSFSRSLRIKDVSRAAALQDGKVHPTQKSVELLVWCIEIADKNAQRTNDNILDLFLGSGTTLIACEQTGRTCYGMELDPKYVDVICRRFFEFTGIAPIRDGDGAVWDEVAA